MYVDHSNTSVAFPTMVHLVIENVYTRSNFHFPISKSFDRPKPKPIPIVLESSISLSAVEGIRQQYSAGGLSDQTIGLLESSRRPGTLHHYKTEWRKWDNRCLSKNIDLVYAGANFVFEFFFQTIFDRIRV